MGREGEGREGEGRERGGRERGGRGEGGRGEEGRGEGGRGEERGGRELYHNLNTPTGSQHCIDIARSPPTTADTLTLCCPAPHLLNVLHELPLVVGPAWPKHLPPQRLH